jgi:hypothetical protein
VCRPEHHGSVGRVARPGVVTPRFDLRRDKPLSELNSHSRTRAGILRAGRCRNSRKCCGGGATARRVLTRPPQNRRTAAAGPGRNTRRIAPIPRRSKACPHGALRYAPILRKATKANQTFTKSCSWPRATEAQLAQSPRITRVERAENRRHTWTSARTGSSASTATSSPPIPSASCRSGATSRSRIRGG